MSGLAGEDKSEAMDPIQQEELVPSGHLSTYSGFIGLLKWLVPILAIGALLIVLIIA